MIGWLHCVPDGQDGVQKSRAQMAEFPLPPCYPYDYISGWFNELRMSFDYVDISAWSALTGWNPSPVEVKILMAMTTMYRGSLTKYKSKEFNDKPPHDCRSKQQIVDQTAMNLKAFFGVKK